MGTTIVVAVLVLAALVLWLQAHVIGENESGLVVKRFGRKPVR